VATVTVLAVVAVLEAMEAELNAAVLVLVGAVAVEVTMIRVEDVIDGTCHGWSFSLLVTCCVVNWRLLGCSRRVL
jgi:hypothetical protein